ncbi:MAG: tyrosine-type recombinase/integrase [Methanoregula sp.]|nr:tyrosine-type recombinase/integrase [Methanoregula sp.]
MNDTSRDRAKDLETFVVGTLQNISPLTARNLFASVNNWLQYNDTIVTANQLKFIRARMPKGKVQTIEDEMDIVTLQKILLHCDLKLKALILFLVSSGCRLGETLLLNIDDIEINGDGIGKVNIPGSITKTGDPRLTFISSEAVNVLKAWLTIRPAYMESARNKANGLNGTRPDPATDNRIFPLGEHTAIASWNLAIEKAGVSRRDRTTGRKTLHLHMTRKFFRSQIALKIPVDIAEALMGHGAYLTDAYRRYTKKQIAEYYKKGESVLTILSSGDISEVREQLESTTKDLQATKQGGERTASALSGVVLENQELKTQLEQMRAEILEMQNAAAGQTSEISELREQTKAISKLVEALMSENVKTQDDKAVAHGQAVVESLLKSPRRK